MGAAFSLAALGIAITIFFGLGGVDLAFGAKDQLQNAIKSRTEESKTSRRTSEREAEFNTEIDKTVPKSRKVTRSRAEENKTIAENIASTAASTARQAADLTKLDDRRASKSTRSKAFSKSGAEIIREKQIQEIQSKNVLKEQGNTFSGTGKFGRAKLNANSNFDLGLSSDATAADRARVLERKAKIDAARARSAARRNNRKIAEKKFQGKTETELRAIAKSRGLKFNTSISASSLANVLLRTGGI